MQLSMIDQFRACARAGVPIVAIQTPDQFATIATLAQQFANKRPLIRWDVCNGMQGLNDKGKIAFRQTNLEPGLTQNPVEALMGALKLPTQSILLMLNVPLFLEGNPTLIQAIANTRDAFKGDARILVLLGPQFSFGPELARDIIIIDEPLPEFAAIDPVVRQQFVNASLTLPPEPVLVQASKTLLGCSLFEAEQVTATSLSKEGLDQYLLDQKRRQTVAATKGLSMFDPRGKSIAMVGGLSEMKRRFDRIINGRFDIGTILFIDEAEKAFAGAKGDTSGVGGDFHGYFLSWLQDNDCIGMISVGAPGAGKSFIASLASTLKKTGPIPFVQMDMGGMKNQYVGTSEANFRNGLKVIRGMTPNRILVNMTCNDLDVLSPELKSRMTIGTFFFDLPTEEERASIWPLYLSKYELGTLTDVPEDIRKLPWTGREIRACCEMAYNESITLAEAATSVVPVSLTDAERINVLRQKAHNTFLSASYPGTYQQGKEPESTTTRQIGWDSV